MGLIIINEVELLSFGLGYPERVACLILRVIFIEQACKSPIDFTRRIEALRKPLIQDTDYRVCLGCIRFKKP